ncbi:MAG: 50S ribosomal protein L18 [Candidatus Gracilibacteria bacterium]|nr:50S ribosomal protein L18 [Candidatus Gracilibacteria bacterium]
MLKKTQNRLARAKRVRARMEGTASKPRLSVFRSNTHISVQAIDDASGVTLCAAHDMAVKSGTKSERATAVGSEIAKTMLAKGITECVFDRGGYLYHGRVKSLAEAARAGGLKF